MLQDILQGEVILNFLIGGVSVIAVFAVVAVLKMAGQGETIDIDEVINDFRVLRSAFIQFKKDDKGLCEDLKTLIPYMKENRDIAWERYSISIDQKYMIVKDAKRVDAEQVLKRIGGASFIKGNKLFLSFSSINTISKVEPVAEFKIIPAEGYTTTTRIEFDHSMSVTEDNEINDVKWENMQNRYAEPGIKKIRLKVQDKNGNWSEWTEQQIVVKEIKGVKSIHAGYDTIFVVHNNGKVDGFGHNEFGQLAMGNTESAARRKVLKMVDNADQIDGGEYHTVILTNDRKVFTCGRNHFGQLGQGDRTDTIVPKQIWGLESIKQVSAGENFAAALSTSGHVYTWGNNEYGQLGTEPSYFKEIPARVEGVENIKAISCGSTHMLALGFDGTVHSWGDNRHGQLGLGFKGKHNDPTVTTVSGVKYVCAGKNFSLAITEAGKVKIWGSNTKSQLGIEGESEVLFPEEILELKGIVELATKGNFVVARDDIGQVYTWGHYSGMDDDYPTKPVRVGELKYIKSVAATTAAGYAVDEKGEVLRWNRNISKVENVLFFEEDTDVSKNGTEKKNAHAGNGKAKASRS